MKAIYNCKFYYNELGREGSYNSTTFFSNKKAAEKFGKEACEHWKMSGHYYTFEVIKQGLLSEW